MFTVTARRLVAFALAALFVVALLFAAGLGLGVLTLNTHGSSVGVNAGPCGVYVGAQTTEVSGPYVQVGGAIVGAFCGDY